MDFDALKKLKSDSITFSADNKILTINNKNEEMTIWDKYKDETTYWQDLDKNGKYDTKVIVLAKNKPTIFKLDESKNNALQIQKQEWEQLGREVQQEYLNADKKYKEFGIYINKKIDDFKQNTAGKAGDCWLLSGLHALSLSVAGQRAIKQAISQDDKGNIKVYLKGINESYTFSPEEIIKAEERLSTGDDDVRAIEMAVEQHRLKVIKSGKGVKICAPSEPNLDKRIGDDSLEQPLYGGGPDEIIFLLTGQTSKYYSSSFLNRLFYKGFSSDVDACLSQIQNNPDKYACCVDFKSNKGDIRNNHIYSVLTVDKDYVTVVNPWDSSKNINIKKEDFIKNYSQITFCDILE